jgi:hypothetical protein
MWSLIVLGLFLPSSINGVELGVAYYFLNATIFSLILLLAMKKVNYIRLFFVMIILVLMGVNTYASYFSDYQVGVILIIIPVLFLFSIDLKKQKLETYMKTLNIISIILFILGVGIIFEIKAIQNFLESYYVTSFTDLYMYMIAANRPVGPFGTHSIAAFMYFILFFIYYVSWLKYHKTIYLIFSILFIVLMAMLVSFTALAFSIFIVFTFLNYRFLLKKVNFQFLILNISIVVIAFFAINSVVDVIGLLAGTSDNGLTSRYGPHGVLGSTIEYLRQTSFLGDGIGYSDKLKYTDSGYVHSLLIYGILGTILFYMIFYMTLNKNKSVAKFIILGAILFFEIGYDLFFYTKTVFVLIMIYFFLLSFESNNISTRIQK